MSGVIRFYAAAILAVVVLSLNSLGDELFEPKDVGEDVFVSGALQLTVHNPKVHTGEKLAADVTFSFYRFLNVTNTFWDPQLGSVPAKLAIFDKEKPLIGWHYLSQGENLAAPDVRGQVWTDSIVGRLVRLTTGVLMSASSTPSRRKRSGRPAPQREPKTTITRRVIGMTRIS